MRRLVLIAALVAAGCVHATPTERLLVGLLTAKNRENPAPTYILIGATGIEPTPVHRAVWEMMERCSGNQLMQPETVVWAVADSIVEFPSGRLAYGLSIREEPLIVLERQRVMSARIASREVLHVMGFSEDAETLRRCTLHDGPTLPARTAAQSRLPELAARGDVVGG